MPTERKVRSVEELSRLIEGSTILISADYTGMSVDAMTAMRSALRQRHVEFHVVKNNLTYLAADAAGRPLVKEIVHGPSGIAFGRGDPVEPAKALTEFIRSSRSPLTIRGGVLGNRMLTSEEVQGLATLPSKEQLIANLMAQLQGPLSGLMYVLNAPAASLARVLQRRAESLGESEPQT